MVVPGTWLASDMNRWSIGTPCRFHTKPANIIYIYIVYIYIYIYILLIIIIITFLVINWFVYIYIYVCVAYTCRERERELYVYIFCIKQIHRFTHTICTDRVLHCVWIYIYINKYTLYSCDIICYIQNILVTLVTIMCESNVPMFVGCAHLCLRSNWNLVCVGNTSLFAGCLLPW